MFSRESNLILCHVRFFNSLIRRVSEEILKTLRMAHNNAKYLNVPTENLIVSQCVIGRGTPTKRYQIHAKGIHILNYFIVL